MADEKQEEELSGVDLEIAAYFKVTDKLIDTLEQVIPMMQGGRPKEPQALLKLLKPLCMTVENTLPQLWDLCDNLSYLKDDQADRLRQKVRHLEEDLLLPMLDFIRRHDEQASEIIVKDEKPYC
ncbi:MAG: hypothetical protein K6F05_07570 [Succinivibrio sp.]|nr:hypothetical protein [Succinivibrio sp.]